MSHCQQWPNPIGNWHPLFESIWSYGRAVVPRPNKQWWMGRTQQRHCSELLHRGNHILSIRANSSIFHKWVSQIRREESKPRRVQQSKGTNWRRWVSDPYKGPEQANGSAINKVNKFEHRQWSFICWTPCGIAKAIAAGEAWSPITAGRWCCVEIAPMLRLQNSMLAELYLVWS